MVLQKVLGETAIMRIAPLKVQANPFDKSKLFEAKFHVSVERELYEKQLLPQVASRVIPLF